MDDTPTLDRVAEQVGGEMRGGGVGFDPASILAILTTIIGLFQNCKLTPAQAARKASHPGLLDRIILRRAIRACSTGKSVDLEAVEAALLDAGPTLTAADWKKLYAEAS